LSVISADKDKSFCVWAIAYFVSLSVILQPYSYAMFNSLDLDCLLQHLENFVSTHKDDAKSRITAISQALLNVHIMVGMVTSDRDAYIARLEKTLDEVSFTHNIYNTSSKVQHNDL